MAAVYIVVLNYNGADDTLMCLASLSVMRGEDFRTLVVDNGSTDDSLRVLEGWKETHALDMEIIAVPANLGYAAGNNVGIRRALADETCRYVWLLNNDTLVDPGALDGLLACMRHHPQAGIVGSKLLDFEPPHRHQGMGGLVNRWFATTSHIGEGELDRGQYDHFPAPDYIGGASCLIPRSCLEVAGMLPEEYFLYMEDVDYSYRVRGCGFRLVLAPESLVYHKQGAGSGTNKQHKSYQADTLGVRNRVRFARQHLRPYLPTVYLGVFFSLVLRLRRRQWPNARYMLDILIGSVR